MSVNNVQCSYCGIDFHKKPSQVIKSKNHYCCEEHLRLAIKREVPLVECNNCGLKIPLNRRRKRNSKTGIYFCGVDCRNKYVAREKRWADNPNSHRDKRQEVITRANNKCEYCGYDEDARMFDIHHKNGDHSDNGWDNLMCVCAWCHIKHHRGVKFIEINSENRLTF